MIPKDETLTFWVAEKMWLGACLIYYLGEIVTTNRALEMFGVTDPLFLEIANGSILRSVLCVAVALYCLVAKADWSPLALLCTFIFLAAGHSLSAPLAFSGFTPYGFIWPVVSLLIVGARVAYSKKWAGERELS